MSPAESDAKYIISGTCFPLRSGIETLREAIRCILKTCLITLFAIKHNRMKVVKLITLSLFSCFSCLSNDTLDVAKMRAGGSLMYEFIHSNISNSYSGEGWRIGAYLDVLFTERALLSGELNYGHKKYVQHTIQGERKPDSDTTSVFHVFNIDKKKTVISPTARFRFFYTNNPKLYLLAGVGADFNIGENNKVEYISSFLPKSNSGQFVMSNVRFQNLDKDAVTLNLELGIGIEIKNISVELFYSNARVKSIGARARYHLWNKKG